MNKLNEQPKENPTVLQVCLGDILREHEMSQADFSRLSGLSRNAVSTLVNQPAQIRIETIALICNSLNITVAELFKWESDPS